MARQSIGGEGMKGAWKREVVDLWGERYLRPQGPANPIYMAIKEYINDISKSRESRESYGAKHPHIKYDGGATKIHRDFSGWLLGNGWVIYAKDEDNVIYFHEYPRVDSISTFSQDTHVSIEERDDWVRTFGLPYMTDITKFIEEPSLPFINWFGTNPLEVKE